MKKLIIIGMLILGFGTLTQEVKANDFSIKVTIMEADKLHEVQKDCYLYINNSKSEKVIIFRQADGKEKIFKIPSGSTRRIIVKNVVGIKSK